MTPFDTPLTLPSGLVLPNRIAKAPMTENLADADNQPTVRHERVYRRWAEGGAGLLVTGNLMVDRRYLERSRNIVADRHLDLGRLARVREAAGSTPMIAQLSHPGRQTNRFIARHPVAPSGGKAVSMLGLFGKPRPLTAEEIGEIVRRFGEAAQQVEQAGFDGLQVHAAHGYLLAQFLSPHTNRRTDSWGGDVAGRARALLEVIRSCRSATGDGFAVAVKLNSSDFRHGGLTEDHAEQVVKLLVDEGVDLIEISGGTYESPALLGLAGASESTGPGSVKEAYFSAFATRARRAAPDVPIMLTGGIRTRTAMQALLDSGAVDVIGMGRPIALDPDLPANLLRGEEGRALPSYRLPTALGLAGESEWYEHQIGRLGDGLEPEPDLNEYLAAGSFLVGEAIRGLREGPRRRKLATAPRS
ncbi:MAG: NADH:flavin oxidoreductase/NADH oxidase family protein [Aeromicrobium sp.]